MWWQGPRTHLPIATDPIIKWAATRWPTYVVRYWAVCGSCGGLFAGHAVGYLRDVWEVVCVPGGRLLSSPVSRGG